MAPAARADRVVTYFYTDPNGTPLATADSQGRILSYRDNHPYGAPAMDAVDGVGFTGHVVDEDQGLVYMQARYFDPATGRFLSVDPILDLTSPFGFNVYLYGNADPFTFTDPTGMCSQGKAPDPVCQEPQQKRGPGRPPVSPSVQRMRDTSDRKGGSANQPPVGPDDANVDANIEAMEKADAQLKSTLGVLSGQRIAFKYHLFYLLVRNHGPWDYKQRKGGDYQAFGNFNYGASGRAFGIPSQVLLRAAGAAQLAAGTSDPGWGSPAGGSPYGDDPNDQVEIQRGIDYYQGKGH
jgi:RHS repeat-associated protein